VPSMQFGFLSHFETFASPLEFVGSTTTSSYFFVGKEYPPLGVAFQLLSEFLEFWFSNFSDSSKLSRVLDGLTGRYSRIAGFYHFTTPSMWFNVVLDSLDCIIA
jgi:hypothetical protein